MLPSRSGIQPKQSTCLDSENQDAITKKREKKKEKKEERKKSMDAIGNSL